MCMFAEEGQRVFDVEHAVGIDGLYVSWAAAEAIVFMSHLYKHTSFSVLTSVIQIGVCNEANVYICICSNGKIICICICIKSNVGMLTQSRIFFLNYTKSPFKM